MKFSLKFVLALVCLPGAVFAQTSPQNALPLINQVVPASERPAQGITLTILGANFSQGATVQISTAGGINVQSTSTTVNSSGTQIVATFPTSNAFSIAGTLAVVVSNGPGLLSNVASFRLTFPTTDVRFVVGRAGPAVPAGAAVISADFNGDGIPDVAATYWLAKSIEISLGSADGSFSNPTLVPVAGSAPAGIVAGDFNGDGRIDLAVTDAVANTVQILIGHGDGTFTPGPPIPLTGVNPRKMVAADFNGDGKLDLAIIDYCGNGTTGCQPTGAPFGPGFLTILLGNGDGTFTTSPISPATGVQPASIVAGDFNADGLLDLAIVNTGSNNVTLLMGNGDGTFTPATTAPVTGNQPLDLVAADFDGDGLLDLGIINSGDNTAAVLFNQGCPQAPPASCTFAARQQPVFVGSRPQALAAADMNGDGFLDLVSVNYGDSTMSVLLNDGTGAFSSTFPRNFEFFVSANPLTLLIGDFNNDGRPDVVLTGMNANSYFFGGSVAGIAVTADNSGTSQFGQTVTFTATLTAAPGAADGGVVTFLDGNTSLGSATVVSSHATFQTSALSAGTHQISASYGGDANYPATSSNPITQVVQSVASTTSLTSDVNPSGAGQTVTLTAVVSGGTATGNITFTDGTTSTLLGTAALSSNRGQITVSNLSTSSHSITAAYSGDSNLQPSTSSPLTQTVNQTSTTTAINSNTNPSSFGQSILLSASIQPAFGNTATGTITFLDGSTPLGTIAVGSNAAQFALSSLSVGTHSFTARYNGDANLQSSTSPALQQVVNSASTSTLASSSANPSSFGQSVTLGATVSTAFGGTPTGTVTWSDGSLALGTAPLSAAASAQLVVSTLSAGSHSISAAYSGDTSFSASASAPLTQTVTRASTTTVLTSSLNPAGFGQAVTLTATVQNGVSGTATGTVTFLDGANTLGTVAVASNAAQLSVSSLSVGSHSITASYSGDASFSSSTSAAVSETVSRASTTTALTSSLNPAGFGQAVTLTATVQNGVSGTATGTVTFLDGANTLGTVALASNAAQLSVSSLSVGSHSITASYSGDASFSNSTSAAVSETVSRASTTTALASSLNPASFGQSVTFTATVQNSVSGTATGTVTFLDGSSTLGTVAVASNAAQLSVSSLAVGSHSITASYSGDASFSSSTSAAVSETVSRASTTTALTSSVNPAGFGQAVTFTPTVQNSVSGTATGTVTFLDGANTLGTVALASNAAQLSVSSLSVGSHSITASYSGDSSFSASASAALSETVTRASTTTALASSLNPAGFGQALTFTATVQTSAGTATGSVSFVDNGVQLGSATLSGNVARFTSSAMPAGSHSVVASYSGDGNFSPSTSASLAQSVIAAATSTNLTSSLNPANAGQTVNFTASVTSGIAGTQTGTVNFYVDGGSTPAASSAVSSGSALFSTSALAGGTHTVTATFVSSNSNFASSSSPALSQTIKDFALSLSPTSLTITRGHSGAYTLTVTPVSGFSGVVSISCGGAPANTTCTVTPTQVTLTGSGSAQVSVQVSTTKKAVAGTYSLNLAASSSSTSHTAVAQLILN